ncbi:hypothetical protein [Hymenobacter profundi]|uniref:DUF3575 domain-containing protein n=1 Tax=Hymenobacter profundi TaxID=1982110 RepID=A0ABS6WXT2_9BACT|nr:hypothetical protein [Hymenobacter profundi]MBW3128400.1 hypothetical protein [Hymenobacter profundi]
MRPGMFTRWLTGWGVACGSLIAAKAQTPVPPVRTYSVKVDLAPMMASGYHVSAEKLWGPAYRHALVLTPQFYRGKVQNITSDVTDGRNVVRGYGLAVQHRIYLSERTTPQEGFYVGYGPHYQHFELEFRASSWQPEVADNGLTYYEYRARNQKETINRYGATAVLGGQLFLPDLPIFLDVYMGFGLRKAHARATLPGSHYNRGMSDYGTSGYYLPVGFRVGVAW